MKNFSSSILETSIRWREGFDVLFVYVLKTLQQKDAFK
jgi:hypothetical protein